MGSHSNKYNANNRDALSLTYRGNKAIHALLDHIVIILANDYVTMSKNNKKSKLETIAPDTADKIDNNN